MRSTPPAVVLLAGLSWVACSGVERRADCEPRRGDRSVLLVPHVDGMPDQLDVAGAAYHTFHQGFLGA